MADPTLCVCDETRESLVCKAVHLLDTARTPFNAFVRHVAQISEASLWLNPFRGIPPMPGLPATEVVLLDRNAVVLECIPELSEHGLDDKNQRTASALVLPASTIIAAQIQERDQLRICNAETRIEWALDVVGGLAAGRQCSFLDELAQENLPTRTQQVHVAILKLGTVHEQAANVGVVPVRRKAFWKHLLGWVSGSSKNVDRRRGARSNFPKLVAYYWAGRTPKALRIGNIDRTGFYLITEDRWERGTRILINLQRTTSDIENPDDRIAVLSKVVRFGPDGVGFEIVTSAAVDPESGKIVPSDQQSRDRQLRFLQRATSNDTELGFP